jgi:hypothetical protein
MFVNHQQDDWVDWLPLAEFTYNNARHEATGQTLFFLNKGWRPRTLPCNIPSQEGTTASSYLEELEKAMKAAEESLRKAKAAMKAQWDCSKWKEETYEVGDRVFVQAEYLPKNRASRKLDDKWRGPFDILAKKGEAAYELDLPLTWKGHRTLNASQLKWYTPPLFPGQKGPTTRPDLIIVSDRREEYEVHEVLNKRRKNNRTEYLIRWKDYRPEDDTWEPEENLKNAKGALRDYRTQGWAHGEEGHHVAPIIQEMTQIKPGLIKVQTGLQQGMNQVVRPNSREQDTGPSIEVDTIRPDLIGKLCRWALALIKYKVGADVDVSERMVRALEEWLQRWGITIYTESFLLLKPQFRLSTHITKASAKICFVV